VIKLAPCLRPVKSSGLVYNLIAPVCSHAITFPQVVPEDVEPLDKTMETLARVAEDRLRKRTSYMQLIPKPFFQDYDRVNKGVVTRPQFRAVLSSLRLNDAIKSEEELEALVKKYTTPRGDVDYVTFCKAITVDGLY
jgi:hypothetical protein